MDGLAYVVSLAAIAVVLALALGLPFEVLQLPAGLLAGFFAPGYLLLRASVGPHMRGAMRFVLPVPLTLALAVVVGVFVEPTEQGVRGDALAVAVCLVSVGLAAICFVRGTHPVTLAARDMRPSLLDVLRGAFRGERTATANGPPLAADLALSASVILALAVAGLWVSRSIDVSSADVGSVALGGRLQASAPSNGLVPAVAELTVENHRSRQTEGNLRITVEPRSPGMRPIDRGVIVPAASTTRAAVRVRVPCNGSVRVTFSNPRGARRALRLRVSCPPAA
jgi:hypothetical protein